MKKRIVLNKNLYDFYEIQIPLSVLVRNKAQKYLTSELGKRHPCFSDEFCFDAKTAIAKKGLMEKVVVMNKYKLSEFKANNPGQRLYIEENKNSVFQTGFGSLVNHPVGLLIFTVLLFFTLAGLFWLRNVPKVSSRQKVTEVQVIEKEIPTEVVQIDYINELIEVLKTNHSVITSFNYRFENPYEFLTVQVKNLYPEQLISWGDVVSCSDVVYKQGKPELELKLRFRKTRSFENTRENPVLNLFDVREFLKTQNCEIVEEGAGRIKFFSEADKALFSDFAGILEQRNLCVCDLRVLRSDQNRNEIEMKLAEGNFGFNLAYMDSYLQFFEKTEVSAEKLKKDSVVTKTEILPETLPGKKIGEVAYRDGSKLVFYKTLEGKTIKRKE